jgi:hypothetical protein
MNNFIKTSLSAIMFTVAIAAVGTSCKKKFDAPPADAAPVNMTANTTIAQLKARHTVSGALDKIDSGSDIIIRGIVIADDRNGNFYKQIVIQDTTGGIQVNIGGTNLYTSYPVGREVFIKCNNLYLSDYNNAVQLGAGVVVGSAPSLSDIPTTTINSVVFKGSLNNVVTPKDVTLSQLGTTMQDRYQNTLVRLSNFQFNSADTASTIASAGVTSPSSASYNLQYCADISSQPASQTLELYTSNYANFAATPVPNGNGTITGVFVLYRTFKELIIRDASDINFTGNRCGFTPPPTGTVLLKEDFESQVVPATSPFNAVAVTGWFNGPEAGGKNWDARIFSSNKYAQVSAFGSTQATVTSWLVTKGINLGAYATKTLSFGTSGGFNNGATLKVMVSTNYTGTGNPWAAGVNWTDLSGSATFSTIPSSGYATGFTNSGNISLNSYSGTVYIAFKYEGADPTGTASDKTTTWQIDNIYVVGN